MELQRGILTSLQTVLPKVAHEAETALIDLALEAARKIVAGLPMDAALVEQTVREALRQAEDTRGNHHSTAPGRPGPAAPASGRHSERAAGIGAAALHARRRK